MQKIPEAESFLKVQNDIKTRYGDNGFKYQIDLKTTPPTFTIVFVNQCVPCGNMWYWDKNALLNKEGEEGVKKKCIEFARKHGIRLEQLKFKNDNYMNDDSDE